MENINHFRTIIPIYNFVGKGFNLSGNYKDAEYKIELIFAEQNVNAKSSILANIIKNDYHLNNIYSDILFNSDFRNSGNHLIPIIIIDCIHKNQKDLNISSNSKELLQIERAIIQVLKLITDKSILTNCSYTIKIENGEITNNSTSGYSKNIPNLIPYFLFHGTDGLSKIDLNLKITIEQLFQCFLTLYSETNNEYTEILNIALSYFNTSICLDLIEHSFLMLLIIIEIIFKLDETEQFDKAIKRYKIFTNYNKKSNFALFNQNKNKNFELGIIRNTLAHGKSHKLDEKSLKLRYDELFFIIRNAIVILILKQKELINKQQNEWFKFTKID